MDRHEVLEALLLLICTVAGFAVMIKLAHMLATAIAWALVAVQP